MVRRNSKQVMLRVIFFLLASTIVFLPFSSFALKYRYEFSWSMYNGRWQHEYYKLQRLHTDASFTMGRLEVMQKYSLSFLLPYGSDGLKTICRKDKSLGKVTRYGKFSLEQSCQGGKSDT